VNAQTDTSTQHSPLKREKFRLAVDMPNSPALKKDELKLLLPQDQLRGYNHARRCYIASIPLLSIGAACAAWGSFFLVGGIIQTEIYKDAFSGSILALAGFAGIVVSLPFLIPGVTLIVNSKNRLNNIVNDYNSPHTFSYQPVKLNLGFVGNGIGIKLTF